MNVEITLKNYRCFSDSMPARFVMRSGITAFVGTNNSGKSSLLKFFYEFRRFFQRFTGPNGNFMMALQGERDAVSFASSVLDDEEIFCNSNDRDLSFEISFPMEELSNIPVDAKEFFLNKLIIEVQHGTTIWTPKFQTQQGILQFTRNGNPGFENDFLCKNGVRCIYLAGVWDTARKILDTLYIGPYRNAINTGTAEAYFDISVGQDFIEKWRKYKTGNSKQQNEAIYKITEDIRKIFNFNALEINASEDNKTLQLFIDGKSYKLSELGAGLTQFIMVLVTVAIRRPSFILIDEPELNLHPSLQLDFLTTLASYATEGVLFATHSIGLARASADRIYTVQRNSANQSVVAELETTPRLSEFLGELSFSGYKELGFDKILLVEGSTEIKAIQQILRMWGKDHKIVLLPLGGSQLINDSRESELREIKRISENIYALIDSERQDANAVLQADRAAFVELCQRVGISCHVLERRATDNYWSDRAIKKVKGDKYRALAPFEKLKEASPAWSKSEGWRIAREMTLSEIRETDLGIFLENL